jgi:hypothetical protein
MVVPDEWIESAREAADSFARRIGISDLTQAEADEFSALGQSAMQTMIGRPVGITPDHYRDFLDKSLDYSGPDLDFMLSLLRGEHLTDEFLANAG